MENSFSKGGGGRGGGGGLVTDGILVMQVVGGKQGDTNTRTSLNQDMRKTHLSSKYAINVF